MSEDSAAAVQVGLYENNENKDLALFLVSQHYHLALSQNLAYNASS
jgi:hypothetical protein